MITKTLLSPGDSLLWPTQQLTKQERHRKKLSDDYSTFGFEHLNPNSYTTAKIITHVTLTVGLSAIFLSHLQGVSESTKTFSLEKTCREIKFGVCHCIYPSVYHRIVRN